METIVEVEGINGDVVVIAGRDTGVDGMWLATDISGLYDPEIQAVTKDLARRPGSKFLGYRILKRTLVFRVTIANDTGIRNTWRERDERWRRLWAYDAYSKIRVTTDEGSRTLSCRLESIEVDTEHDPHTNSATDVTMTVVADDPFWYGKEFRQEITVNGSGSFRTEYANPTSNTVYPIFVLEAPGKWTISEYISKTETRNVELPELSYGQDIVVNTDPAKRQIISDDDTLVWAKMNGVRMDGAIPPHTEEYTFPISVSGGPRTAQLRIPRPYNRPWGY